MAKARGAEPTGAVTTVALPARHQIHQDTAAAGWVGLSENIPYNPATTATGRITSSLVRRVRNLTSAGHAVSREPDRGSLTIENGNDGRVEAIETREHGVVINMQRRVRVQGPWETVATMIGSHGGEQVIEALEDGLRGELAAQEQPIADAAQPRELIRASHHDAVLTSQREFAGF